MFPRRDGTCSVIVAVCGGCRNHVAFHERVGQETQKLTDEGFWNGCVWHQPYERSLHIIWGLPECFRAWEDRSGNSREEPVGVSNPPTPVGAGSQCEDGTLPKSAPPLIPPA